MDDGSRGVSPEVAALIAEAVQHYPHADTAKAMALFLRAVELSPDPPRDQESLEAVDNSDTGFACWAVFVCFDLLDTAERRPWAELAVLIDRKSPVTGQRIRDQLATYSASRAAQDKVNDIAAELESLLEEGAPIGAIREKLVPLIDAVRTTGAWWDLRDLGNVAAASPGHADIAWSLYNAALNVSMTTGGKLSSIYAPMAALRKKEGAYVDAAKLFLIACADMHTKHAAEQLRICLRKAGVSGDCAVIRDALLAKVNTSGRDAALADFKALTSK